MKQQSINQSSNRKKGFTLIELMVVIIILAILAALIIPKVVTRQDDAKFAQAQTNMKELAKALEQFRIDCDRYPTSEEGLEALREAPADVNNWRGPYITKGIPPDPWTRDFEYDSDGQTFTIMSLGADGIEEGEGNNRDIVESSD